MNKEESEWIIEYNELRLMRYLTFTLCSGLPCTLWSLDRCKASDLLFTVGIIETELFFNQTCI